MRLWIPVLTGGLLVLSGAIGFYLWTHYAPPPAIQGAYLQPARGLPSFTLTDHNHETFSRQRLRGQWHLVSYGYTHCPDICPMTLATLSRWVRTLESRNIYPDLKVLFYSVDSERDTPEVLAEYVPYFHPDFLGLTHQEGRSYRNFEQGLGIVAENTGSGEWVNHGVMLLLVNPKAQLQAVFKPERNEHGLLHFEEKTLLEDYRAIRDYYARQHPPGG